MRHRPFKRRKLMTGTKSYQERGCRQEGHRDRPVRAVSSLPHRVTTTLKKLPTTNPKRPAIITIMQVSITTWRENQKPRYGAFEINARNKLVAGHICVRSDCRSSSGVCNSGRISAPSNSGTINTPVAGTLKRNGDCPLQSRSGTGCAIRR